MRMRPLRVGLIGFGAIGSSVVELARGHSDELEIVAACTQSGHPRHEHVNIPVVDTCEALLSHQPDIVVEIAGHAALREHGPMVLRSGRNLIAVSVGIIADRGVERELQTAALEGNSQLRIASGAIGALDALAAASIGGLDRVTHTTRKPASTLAQNYSKRLVEEYELFSGPAREAVMLFPESVNVTASVSLAGIGFDRTFVRVISDPKIDRNVHLVEAEGAFGSFRFEIRNVPSDSNPRTGLIVAMSIISVLRQPLLAISVG